MNTIKSKSLMKYLREEIECHIEAAGDTRRHKETRNMMAYTAMILRNVRIVAAECIKEGEWLAKRGGK
jgi:hypothetical protein